MIRIKKHIPVFILLTVILFSCEYKKREPFNLDSLPDEIIFETDVAPRFSKCTQCHNGTTPPNLTAEEAYLELTAGGYINTDNPEKSKLYEAIDGGAMTQYATDEDRAYILEWITQGALDN